MSGHRFALLEDDAVPDVDFSGNGLVAVVAGGAVIRTGVADGHVRLLLSVLDGPPPDVATGWEEIVEVSWRASVGSASVAGPQAVRGSCAGSLHHGRATTGCGSTPVAETTPTRPSPTSW